MSFYVESKMKLGNENPFGKHHRVIAYSDTPNYNEIISAEVSGDYIERLPNTHEEKGKLLVMSKFHDLSTAITPC